MFPQLNPMVSRVKITANDTSLRQVQMVYRMNSTKRNVRQKLIQSLMQENCDENRGDNVNKNEH